MKNRKTALAAMGAVALAVALTGCVESGRTASSGSGGGSDCPWEKDDSVTTKARIAFQKIPNGDLVVKDLGLLEACMPNAQITWSNFASGGDVVQAYGANSVDIGLMGSSPATIALSAPLELPISIVWIHDIIGSAESLVVRDDSVKDLAGLKGGTIAVPFSSTAHFSLLQALQDAGMDSSKDVKLINLEPEKMPSAWQGNQIDAAWVWDPVLSQLKDSGHIVLSSADTAEAGKPTYDLGTANKKFMSANPAFMDQWAKAQDYAVQLIDEEPDKAAESIAVEVGVSPDEAVKLFEGYSYLRATEQAAPDALGGKMAKDLLTTAKFLVAQGGIAAASSPEVYEAGVDAGPAEAVSR
ncbi:MAG TPA: glycine/betaine ABC transporter substrate-binding protein [Microbacterium sp.]|nr:glycine/betaine ABC transporter substrate-binding protein [Microbacterium sp.]